MLSFAQSISRPTDSDDVALQAKMSPVPGGAKTLDPQRIQLGDGLGKWPLQRWISDLMWLPYVDPAVLERPAADPQTWEWSGPGTLQKVRLFELYRKFDLG
jgi:hypothetical protein